MRGRVLLLVVLGCNAPSPHGVTLAEVGAPDGGAHETPHVVASAGAISTAFFPPHTFPDAVDAFVSDWYGKHLVAMHEPSLWAASVRNQSVYRFLWLRTWGKPIAVRVTLGDPAMPREATAAHLVATRLAGSGGYDPGKIDVQRERDVTFSEWGTLVGAVEAAHFDSIATEGPMGNDGAQWIIERSLPGTYRLVERWTPKHNPQEADFVHACEVFLDLAGKDLVTGEVY